MARWGEGQDSSPILKSVWLGGGGGGGGQDSSPISLLSRGPPAEYREA